MSYLDAPGTSLLATHCALCGRPLLDAASVESGMGPICRERALKDAPDAGRSEVNAIVSRIAARPDAPEVPELVAKVSALGYRKLAEQLSKRLLDARTVTVTTDGTTLVVAAPYSEAFGMALRDLVPGRRWDRDTKTWRIPAASKRGLWIALQRAFPGAPLVSERGITVIGAASPRSNPQRKRMKIKVYGSPALGARLHNWHSGMGDPIYRVGSMFAAGQGSPLSDVEAALEALERIHARRKESRLSSNDVRSLNAVIADLHDAMWAAKDAAGAGYRENPRKPSHYGPTMARLQARVPALCSRGQGKPCVVIVSKDVARAFIEQHHSTQPYLNHRGLLYTLGVVVDGKIVAVASVNTPTARFRKRSCPVDRIVDLSRVASDGSLLGAASMLAAKAIDLLPLSGRNGQTGCLLVTYSLISQAGTTYAALVDKGMRPVEIVEGQKPSGQRRKSSARALPTVRKIRWEAGPAAMPPRWHLLAGVMPPDKLAALAARFDARKESA